MTAPRTLAPEQLDIPLVWDKEADPGSEPPVERTPSHGGLAPLGGTLRLWLAALADAGVVTLAAGASWVLAASQVGGLGAWQVLLAGLAGLETASVVALGCLWGWRATPGMLLVGVCFSRPIAWAHVCRLWAAWVGALLLLGVPLLLRHRGESVAERLAGGGLSFRSLPEGV